MVESIAVRKLLEDRAIVTAHAGVVERRSERFGSAAISLVHAYNMKTAVEGLLADAAHVIRIARTLEAVHEDEDRRIFPLSGLPVAMPKQKRILVHLKTPRFGRRNVEAARHQGRRHRHDMPVFQQKVGLEF